MSPNQLSSAALAAALMLTQVTHATPILGCGTTESPAPYTVDCDQSVSGNVNNGPYTATYRHEGSLFVGFQSGSAYSNEVIDHFVNSQNFGQSIEQIAGANVSGSSSGQSDTAPINFELSDERPLLALNASESTSVNTNAPAAVSDDVAKDGDDAPALSMSASAPNDLAETAIVVALSDDGTEIFEDSLSTPDDAVEGALIDSAVTQAIIPIMASSGGNLPGLGPDGTNLAFNVLAVAEPQSRWIWLLASFMLALRLRQSNRDLA